MPIEAVTEKTVGSDAPDPWLSSWAAHMADWERGLRYSSRLRPSNCGVPSCRLQSAASSPVHSAGCMGRVAHPTSDSGSGAGRLVAGSCELSELASSLTLLLPASCFVARRKGEISFPPGTMFRLRTGTTEHPLAFSVWT
jgi:hypothetical protein